jgi:CO dehydrogenase/acetyl-CoA synthase epsilon subunit
MRRFLFGNVKTYSYLCKKLSYTPCYTQLKFIYMETKFKIVKFTKKDNSFLKDGYDEYSITYLKGTKVHQLRIVVDGYLTKQSINIIDGNSGYKNKILLGIKEYLENGVDSKNKVTKRVTLSYLENFYSKKIVHNVKTFLLPINKEESRDKLTELGLINFNCV